MVSFNILVDLYLKLEIENDCEEPKNKCFNNNKSSENDNKIDRKERKIVTKFQRLKENTTFT